jgi:hypothetical protein
VQAQRLWREGDYACLFFGYSGQKFVEVSRDERATFLRTSVSIAQLFGPIYIDWAMKRVCFGKKKNQRKLSLAH